MDDEFLLDYLDMSEDRQDLSQYSYDPDDRLETVNLLDSQQSSQESDKTDVFLGSIDELQQPDDDDFDVGDPLACQNNNAKERPVLSAENTAEVCVTSWYVRPEEVTPGPGTPIFASQDVSSVLWEDHRQVPFEVQV